MATIETKELGVIPEDWELKKLGDIADNFDKKRKPISGLERAKIQGDYPYCGANGIVDYINSYILDGEYVLLAEDGGYWGKCESSSYIMKGKFWVNNHAHILLAKDRVTTNNFLMHILNYLNLDPYIGGDARGKLTQAIMKSLLIPLPSFVEQCNIAHILSTIQSAVETQEKIIKTTTELKKALMQKLFTDGLHGESKKKTEVGLIPQSWEVVELNDVFQLTSGKERPSQLSPDRSNGYIYPVYGGNGILGYSKECLIDFQTIVLGRVGVYCGSIFLTSGRSWISDNALYAKKMLRQCNLSYLSIALQLLQLNKFKNTGGQPLISQSIVYSKKIAIPSLQEQNELANVFANIEKSLNNAQEKEVRLQELFKSMLHNLMTGQIRVKDIRFS
ncbi:MAG: restriction endonuclease subunit S [Candidatus Omnitrophica bacterium]|nr:restriction endonuclease subunit S [Candidatus Omnitrophota bacterium]